MAEKLDAGQTFPAMNLNLVGGGSVNLPADLDSPFSILLFYRGHWWPNCRRQLVGFAKHSEALGDIGAKIFAASVDPEDKAQEAQNDVPYPVAFGVARDQADAIGAWWEDRRAIVQPSEFILDADGKVLASTYSSGPLGRLDPEDCIKMITRMAE
jgi:peroxiredoxin